MNSLTLEAARQHLAATSPYSVIAAGRQCWVPVSRATNALVEQTKRVRAIRHSLFQLATQARYENLILARLDGKMCDEESCVRPTHFQVAPRRAAQPTMAESVADVVEEEAVVTGSVGQDQWAATVEIAEPGIAPAKVGCLIVPTPHGRDCYYINGAQLETIRLVLGWFPIQMA